MSKLDELIKELCPDGVDINFHTLGFHYNFPKFWESYNAGHGLDMVHLSAGKGAGFFINV